MQLDPRADHRKEAGDIHARLVEHLQTLKFLEYELRNRTAQDAKDRTRARAAFTALERLQQALEALEKAARQN